MLIWALSIISLISCGSFVPVIYTSKIPKQELDAAYRIKTYTPENAGSYPEIKKHLGSISAFPART